MDFILRSIMQSIDLESLINSAEQQLINRQEQQRVKRRFGGQKIIDATFVEISNNTNEHIEGINV